MTRIYERQTDALFAHALANDPEIAVVFLSAVDGAPENQIFALSTQTPHRSAEHRGSIDLEITRFGLVAVRCRSFDGVMCSEGDEPWAQSGRMNFARMRCVSR